MHRQYSVIEDVPTHCQPQQARVTLSLLLPSLPVDPRCLPERWSIPTPLPVQVLGLSIAGVAVDLGTTANLPFLPLLRVLRVARVFR